jgi:Tfp pilus assembly protein PilX
MVKNSKGYALVSVLVLMLVMSLVGAVLLNASLSDTKLTAAQIKNKQAYYAARSGADAMASYIIQNPSKIQELITNTTPSSAYATGLIGTNGSFKIKAKRNIYGDVELKSIGIVDSVHEASITVTVKMNKMIGSALFAGSSINLNDAVINGDLVTNASTITFGSSTQKVNGNITLGPDATPAYISSIAYRATGTVQKMSSSVIINPIDPPSDAVTWNKNTIVSLTAGSKIYVKVNKSEANDVLVKLRTYADNNPTKASQIHLFVSDEPNTSQFLPSILYLPKDYSLFIYYGGDNNGNSIIGNGNMSFQHVVVYAPNAKFHVNGGGSGEFLRGTIIVKDMILPNSGASFVTDPLVNINDMLQSQNFNSKTYSN